MPSPLEEQAQELGPLLERESQSLSELHDAYRTFCEYGWHHFTWKNLAHCLVTYLSTYYRQDANGQLLHSQPNTERVQYLSHLNVEAFGYLTKDALWVLFRQTGFRNDYEPSLGDHRPFQTPAWQYLSSASYNDLQILAVDVANILRERTTSPQATANILSLTPDWRPTFGAEYGIFQFLNVRLSPSDSASLNLLRLERRAARAPLASVRRKGLLQRALSVRNLPNRNKAQPTESTGDESQHRKRFSWPLTGKYRRLFPRRKNVDINSGSSDATIRPTDSQALVTNATITHTVFTASPSSSATASTSTLESLLNFYEQGFNEPTAKCEETTKVPNTATERPIADSPTLAPAIVPLLVNEELTLDEACCDERPISPSSDHQSFVTAKSFEGTASRALSRLTKRSSRDSFLSVESLFSGSAEMRPAPSSAYYRLLSARDLIPEPAVQTDWSGRGQHAEYTAAERHLVPLQTEKFLGRTRTAIVESVRCKRVRLVRKTIKCSKWTGVKREDALREVQHLYRAQHAHIVRLVGTYVIGTDLAILTYPCAEWNLEQFMALARTTRASSARCASALRQFFTCAAKVMDFLHSFPIKHMDIKPQNLLVRDISSSTTDGAVHFKLYFTDFGTSRAYGSVDECDTESPTAFTRTYAAREVVIQETRGLSADMFSLGCVYSEMLATILDTSTTACEPQDKAPETHWTALRTARKIAENEMRPYHSAIEEVRAWLCTLPIAQEPEMLAVRDWALALLSNEASTRPTARQIADDARLPFACPSCNLRKGPEDFEAAEPLVRTRRQVSPHHWERPTRTVMEVPALA